MATELNGELHRKKEDMNGGQNNQTRRTARRARSRFFLCVLSLFLLLAAQTLWASDSQDEIFARRAQVAFDQAQSQFQSRTNDPVAAWDFARTCYDWADYATNKAQRAAIAREGIAACHRSLLFNNSAAAHYYLAMNQGQLASSEMLGALKLVREMEREFKTAAELDTNFDLAGPERNLGLLYRDAPSWPISIGNRQKAREFLEKAAAIVPSYPENLLNLAEAYLKWGDHTQAKSELDAVDALWPQAQQNFTGEKWESSWYDWSKRRDVLRQTLNPSTKTQSN
jgi:tetratricopeptide (TPR) repeat protein